MFNSSRIVGFLQNFDVTPNFVILSDFRFFPNLCFPQGTVKQNVQRVIHEFPQQIHILSGKIQKN